MDQKRQQEYYDELITGYLNQSLSREQEKELGRWVAALIFLGIQKLCIWFRRVWI